MALAGSADRFSVEDLFDAIIFPSRDVAPLYRSTLFQMKDGQSYNGIVAYESADGVILQTGASTTVRLANAEIVSRQPATISIMPTGLLSGAKNDEIADLFAYLKSLPRRR